MSLFLDDGDVRLYHGDALTVLQTMPAESVHMCVTSPPFYGLRDYGTGRWEGGNPDCDHLAPLGGGYARSTLTHGPGQPLKQFEVEQVVRNRQKQYGATCSKCGAQRVDQQIGLEETPEQWVDSLVAVFREVRRVLRDDGTLWLEVGDSYNSIGGTVGGGKNCEPRKPTLRGWTNAKPKDLIGAPWQLAFALRADGWYLRSDIVWSRPNPMPESVTDRPTKSHSYVFLLAKQPRYFFDQEAVREPHQFDGRKKLIHDHAVNESHENYANMGTAQERWPNSGRNVRSVWNIATQPYPEAHFATFPEELARRCILAGTSEQGCCPECGAPWIRQVESELVKHQRVLNAQPVDTQGNNRARDGHIPGHQETKTTGWRLACTHDGHAPCVVLDPFVGSGTVPHVARKHGRHAIGIDLSQSYLELAARRLQQLSLFA